VSPAHVSANGIPRKWPIPEGEPNDHTIFWGGKEDWDQIKTTPALITALTAQYNAAMNRVLAAGLAAGKQMPPCRSPIWTIR
jgi:poly(3-hydroxybutyrate) depolymerase